MAQLDALDRIDEVRADRSLPDQTRHDPSGWPEMIAAGVIPGPVDPTGVPFTYDAAGRRRRAPNSPLLPLPMLRPK
jgi:hypothetical protein